jgi:hypothetical protein
VLPVPFRELLERDGRALDGQVVAATREARDLAGEDLLGGPALLVPLPSGRSVNQDPVDFRNGGCPGLGTCMYQKGDRDFT